MAMEFWGVEVKNGEALKVDPGKDMIVHISQASLGESKKDKGSESIHLYLNVNNQKFVIGTLSHEKLPQFSTEIVLEKGFELSHSWKNGSVYFSGYKVDAHDNETDDYNEDKLPDSDKVNSEPRTNQANPEAKKIDAGKSGKQVSFKEPNEDAKSNEEEEDDSDEDSDKGMSSSEESGDDKGKTVNAGDDSDESSDNDDDDDDDESDDDDSSDEDIPKKPEPSKKRSAEAAAAASSNTPASVKKPKFATPQKTDGRKGSVHVATPHPAKQAGKKPGNSEQAKQQTPKSGGGSHPCKSCNRSFNSENALQSHTKAKHGAAA